MWVKDLDVIRNFYMKYFDASSNEKYTNLKKGFESYFLSFESGPRLEIMRMDSIPASIHDPVLQRTGIIHFAFSLGSKEKVDVLTSTLSGEGYKVIDVPRTTGDGYYESVVLDPEGNRIELTT